MTNLIDYFKTECDNNTNLPLKTKESYKILIDAAKLKRHILKKSIMTIPYNVSNYQLINYIKEKFDRINNTELYTYKEDKTLKLHYYDFGLLSNGLLQVLKYKFYKLKLLLDYLEKIAQVCVTLKIPRIWTLPSGLVVKQSYLEEKQVRIKPFFIMKIDLF